MGETDKLLHSLMLVKQRYEGEAVTLLGGEVVVEREQKHRGSDVKLEK